MLQITNKKQCCGCTACKSICPKNCITMVTDSEGFEYPKVDIRNCINCDACQRVCPIVNSTKKQTTKILPEVYVGYTLNEKIRNESSSGGIFSLLAKYVLVQQGIVVGAVYDANFSVCHDIINSQSDLYKLRGSKYSQSILKDTFDKVKEYLDTQKLVLFSGTGCQVAGLKNFLKKEYKNLITVDILCHGVPSPAVWERYIKELEEDKGKIAAINMRSKSTGWYAYSCKYDFESHNVLERVHFEDPYMRIFLENVCLRPSCHDCKFKVTDSVSDISLGDSWGIDKLLPNFADDRGTSVIVIHSQLGKRVFECIEEDIVYQGIEFDTAIPESSNARISVTEHINRKKFFTDFLKGATIEQLEKHLEMSLKDKVKKKIRDKIKTVFIAVL